MIPTTYCGYTIQKDERLMADYEFVNQLCAFGGKPERVFCGLFYKHLSDSYIWSLFKSGLDLVISDKEN